MDEVRIPTTAREIRSMSFEEMDTIVARFEREKERRRQAEIANVTNKINDAICAAYDIGFRVVIEFNDGQEVYLDDKDDYIIRVTR